MDEFHFSHYSNYISNRDILACATVTLLAAAACFLFSRYSRAGTSIWRLLGLILPILLILEATLFREVAIPGFSPSGVLNWSANGWNRISYNPWSDQVLLNALVFAPAGFAWSFARKRFFAIWLGLAGLSLLIELIQGLTGLGAPDVADLIANSIGAALGATAAWAVLSLAAVRRGVRPQPRTLLMRAALLAGAATVLYASLVVGADRRQARLETELAHLYGASSYEQFARWEKAENQGQNLLLSKEVFDKTSVRPDGMRYGDKSVTIRYPASFFGIRRCVFAMWATGSFAVKRGHGRACTEFIG